MVLRQDLGAKFCVRTSGIGGKGSASGPFAKFWVRTSGFCVWVLCQDLEEKFCARTLKCCDRKALRQDFELQGSPLDLRTENLLTVLAGHADLSSEGCTNFVVSSHRSDCSDENSHALSHVACVP